MYNSKCILRCMHILPLDAVRVLLMSEARSVSCALWHQYLREDSKPWTPALYLRHPGRKGS